MKKNFKKTWMTKVVTFVLASAMVLSSCLVSGNTADAKKKTKVTKVKINTGKVLVLKKGQKKKLSVTVLPKKASNKKVTYKSSNKKVVKVSKKGVVKAVAKKGSAKITVKSKSNKKKKATIKVKIGKPITAIKVTGTKTRQEFYYTQVTNVDKTSANYGKVSTVQRSKWVNKGTVFTKKKSASVTLELGMDKISLKTIYSPKKPTYKKVTYSSSKGAVANVVANTIVPKKVGTTTITVKAADGSGKKAKIKVTVKPMGTYTTPAPTPKTFSSDEVEMIENFEDKTAGTNWNNWTAAGRDISKDGDVMQVVTDPENSANKCLKVIPHGYDLAPVLSFDLPAGKTLNDYTGVYVKLRVVAGPTSDYTYKTVCAYFAKKGTLNYKYAFSTNEDTYNEKTKENPDNAKYYEFWVDKSMALGDNTAKDDVGASLSQMPTVTSQGESAGFKYYEDDPAVGFSTRELAFNKFLSDDLKKLSSLDMVVGASYSKPSNPADPDSTVTWYIDDISLIKKPDKQVPVTGIEVTGADNVTVGTTSEYSAVVTPADATEKGVTWSVSDPAKATIDAATGILTAVAEGSVDVIATAKDGSKVSGTKTVTLKNAAVVSEDYVVDISKAADFTSTAGISSLTKEGDDYVGSSINNNAKYFIDLGETLDLSGYAKMEVVFQSDGGLEFGLWDKDFDITADTWWDKAKLRKYSTDTGTADDHDADSDYKTQTEILSGDLSAIRYISIGANKNFENGTFKIKSFKFLAPEAGAKDILDEYSVTYPVSEDFTGAETVLLGWSNWLDETNEYAKLADKDVTFVSDPEVYASVPASEWDGIALPLDNRKGTADKDFYVEATVKAPDSTPVQVGFSGSNTLANSQYYPGNTMKEYGNDYYVQEEVGSDWTVIKTKITVPAGKFGETRLKGTKDTGFLVKNVKIEEYTNQDVGGGADSGASELPTTATALDLATGRLLDPSNYSNDAYSEASVTFSASGIVATTGTTADTVVIPLGFTVKTGETLQVHITGSVSRGTTENSLRTWLTSSAGNYGNNSDVVVVSNGDNANLDETVTLTAKADAGELILKGPGGSKFENTTITKVEVMAAAK